MRLNLCTHIFLVFFFFSPKQHNDQQLQTYNDRFRLTESVRVVNTLKKKKKKNTDRADSKQNIAAINCMKSRQLYLLRRWGPNPPEQTKINRLFKQTLTKTNSKSNPQLGVWGQRLSPSASACRHFMAERYEWMNPAFKPVSPDQKIQRMLSVVTDTMTVQ